MRFAISGSHRTGKSTLLERLAEKLPGYVIVDEPYHLLQDEGYSFNDPPSLQDFEEQLRRSVSEVAQSHQNVIFDRCPLDLIAYIDVVEGGDGFESSIWLPRVQEALGTLDFIVFLPIEEEDRVALPLDEEEDTDELRAEVDGRLWELLLDDPYRLDVEYIEVEGDVETRVQTVLARLGV